MQYKEITDFQNIVWQYYTDNMRSFPWRETRDPYAILVSEIMLQQTQTHRVIPKYEAFLNNLPTFEALADAKVADVLTLWQGLGYNRRALALKRAAEIIVVNFTGQLPRDSQTLLSLPGIGPYTASAVLTFAFNEPLIFIETNIRRVFIYHFFAAEQEVTDKQLLPYIADCLDEEHPRDWYYALMDYGAALTKITDNPNRRSKHYTKQSAFFGSNRQLRGAIVRALATSPRLTLNEMAKVLDIFPEKVKECAQQLQNEGFLVIEEEDLRLS